MSKGVYSALSGALAAQTALEVTAENLANAGNAGFKRQRSVFKEILVEATNGKERGTTRHTTVAETVIDLSPGPLRATDRPLDIALPPGTFLAVSTARGERYTRVGSLRTDDSGALLSNGEKLMDDSAQPISLSSSENLTISPDGQVLVDGEPAARLKLVKFADATRLKPEGASLYAASEASGAAEITEGDLTVGSLEDSNASPVSAMTELMSTTRLFDSYQRAIDAFRDADRRIVQVPST